jgi:CMP-2-keto-3-deoxyoctulosonic acid synthetase
MMLGWMMAMVILAGVVLELSGHLLTSSRLQAATDRSALAAADVLVGVGGEFPCVTAVEILAVEGFAVESCEVATRSVQVVAVGERRGFSHRKRAEAGVPNGGEE